MTKSYLKRKGFVATIFIAMMMAILNLLLANNYSIINALKTLDMLSEYNQSFEIEVNLISEAKCYLLNNHTLDDFEMNGYIIEVNKKDNGYLIYVDDLIFEIEVNEDMITDYEVSKM